MEVTVQIPDEVAAKLLHAAGSNLSRRTLEALALAEFQVGHITRNELRQTLGFSDASQLDIFLQEHGVYEGYSAEEVLEQVRRMERLGI